MDLEAIQKALQEQGVDGWLFYDFDHRDPIAYRILGLPSERLAKRRWYYLIPAHGSPRKLVHRIESRQLDSLPGEKREYAAWEEQTKILQELLAPFPSIAMQYSPNNQIPYISRVDAGTVELIRSFGNRIVTSADLVQRFEARWTEDALHAHLEAGGRMDGIIRSTFDEIGRRVGADGATGEYAIQQFLLEQFQQHDLVSDDPPLVAVNANSGNAHYETTRDGSASIRAGDFVLLDVWAKLRRPGAVYYDVTWVGFLGERPPERILRVFSLVTAARDRAIEFVQEAVRQRRTVRGWEIDRVARGVIEAGGYGNDFPHRTGHSIGESVHGNGANIDDLETHEERVILPCTGFSIEPGIYLPEFGVRSEVNVYVDEQQARVTGAIQREIVRIPVGQAGQAG
jgi:Xaa-Pro aminopeptidase